MSAPDRSAPGAPELELVTITLTREEWRALTTGVRRNRQISGQLQLGRLGWMVVGAVEAKLPPCGNEVRHG